jgi:16S rRNA (adenine1518-N6/adenine1519-N6)-dimethyltransferase
MQPISHIRTLLEQRGLHPKKRFGQNFLHDHNQLRKLIDAADLAPGDVVLEIGPGTGTLTETLLDAGAQVIAVEIDRDLAALLRETLGERITLIEADALDKGRTLNPLIVEAIGGRPFKLVANLPYNAASPLITALLLDHPQCTRQSITIQREVADRLVANPHTKAYGPLGIIVQALAHVERIGVVPASCFWPRPQVVSAMVRITPRPRTPRPRVCWRARSGRSSAGGPGCTASLRAVRHHVVFQAAKATGFDHQGCSVPA